MNRNFLRSQLSENYLLVEAKPHTFYELVDVINGLDEGFAEEVDEIVAQMSAVSDVLEDEAQRLRQSFNSLLEGIRQAIKRHNPFDELMVENDPLEDFSHSNGNNFVRVVLAVITDLQAAHYFLHETAKNMHAEHIELFSRKLVASNFEDLQAFTIQYQMHAPTVSAFANAILSAEDCLTTVVATGFKISNQLEGYYKALNHRHSSEGIEIHVDPITTDLAMSIYENVDSHGEIQGGKKADEISVYTIRKAELLTEAIKTGLLGTFARDPAKFIQFIEDEMGKLWDSGKHLSTYAKMHADKIRKITKFKGRVSKVDKGRFEQAMIFIRDLNPSGITYKEKTGLLTIEERHELEYKNETLREITGLISEGAPTAELLHYILGRKQELRAYHLEENSFFVCKIGSGNAFTGDAPGELKVVPGIKPSVSLEEVIGSGFQDVVDFMKHILDGAKWFDVFLATSPSRKADKSNVLLVGPQGCLADSSYIQFEVKGLDGRRINHKGGAIETLYRRFHKLPQMTAGPKQTLDDVMYFAPSMNDEGRITQNRILDVVCHGAKECYEVSVKGMEKIVVTIDHEFFTGDQYEPLEKLKAGSKVFVHRNVYYTSDEPVDRNNRRSYLFVKHHPIAGTKIVAGVYVYQRLARSRAVIEAKMNGLEFDEYIARLNSGLIDGLEFLPREHHVHHKDENFLNDDIDNLIVLDGEEHNKQHAIQEHNNLRFEVVETEITSIQNVGMRETYDVKMAPPYHNVIADGFVVHNCGKSEVLRAVASDRKSVGIFAQASDFLTCWKGEAEKNPKRLFEAGLKIQKESRKQVFFLIDEIDTILNDSQGQNAFGGTNLATEFQVLMDGITTYPNLALWGATNHPERIPMPLIRRFSKVIIVGELTQADRVALLKQFLAFLPCSPEMTDEVLDGAAQALRGAVGDIMRKVVDNVWREKMSHFVSHHPEAAEKVLKLLNSDGQKFHPSKFPPEKRQEMFKIMSPFVQVTPEDLLRSIEKHITNIAIQNEIRTAVSVYDNARQFLAALDK